MLKLIELSCTFCHRKFIRERRKYKYEAKKAKEKQKEYQTFCSSKCHIEYKIKSKIKIICNNCGVNIIRSEKEFNKRTTHFCGQSCSALFHNKRRFENGYSTKNIKTEKECTICNLPKLFSIHYTKNLICEECKTLAVKSNKIKTKDKYLIDLDKCVNNNCNNLTRAHSWCKQCFITYEKYKKYVSDFQIKFNEITLTYFCQDCNILFKNENTRSKYCTECLHKRRVVNGQKAAIANNNRSKNEIYFAELCKQKFDSVLTNERYFESDTGKWDADIIIPELKIAVLWNGVWHYKQVRKNTSLKQIQSRDKIKLKVIKNNNFIPYIIKDMGKHNKKFVEEQFQIFLEYIKNL